jgi:transcriptional regulator with XRE-family HTH domain
LIVATLPSWSQKMLALRDKRGETQTDFATILGTSAMSISRYESGKVEPDAATYILLGNLTGAPECWYWWRRAGFVRDQLINALPKNGKNGNNGKR